MKTFRDYLNEKKKDASFKKSFNKGLEKARIAVELVGMREAAGLTQGQLARKIGTSQSTIARLENPDYESYSISTLRKIAGALDWELIVSFRQNGMEEYEEHHEVSQSVVYNVQTWPSNPGKLNLRLKEVKVDVQHRRRA